MKNFIKALIVIPIFIALFFGVSRTTYGAVLEQTVANQDYNGSNGNDTVYQPIGSGFQGHITRFKIINQVNSSTTINIVGCSTTATSTAFTGCDSSGHRVQTIVMKTTDDQTITSLGGGWYLHDFASSSPAMIMNSAYYYTVSGMIDTQGSTGEYFFQKCYTGSASVSPYNCGSINSTYLYLETDGTVGIITGSGTRILSVTPTSGSTVATGTTNTIGAVGYLNEDDLDDYSKLKIHIENSAKSFQNCSLAICSQLDNGGVSRDFEYTLVVEGYFDYSSTTAGLPIGKYYMTSEIRKGAYCFLGICASTQQVYSTTTTFIVGTTTKADVLKDTVIAHMNGLTGGADFTSCAIATFNLLTCGADLIDYAFVPTSDALDYTYNRIHDEILVKPPFGYVTRFITILSTSTVVALPDTSFPIWYDDGNGNLVVGTTTIFQADEMLEGAGDLLENDIKDPITGKNARDITYDLVSVTIWLASFLLIIKDVLGTHKHKP